MTVAALGDAATAEGMTSDAPEAFWQLDNALGPTPSGRALQAGIEKALTEGRRCARPLRLQCDGDAGHRPHWRYVPCGTRYADECQPCADRYAAQMRAVIQGGLTTHAGGRAIAFTLTAPGADMFGDAPGARRPTNKPFDYARAVAWNACLRQAVHDFVQRVKRSVEARGGRRGDVAYWIVVEFQQRGLGHVHGIVCGATGDDIITAAHGKHADSGPRRVHLSVQSEGGPSSLPRRRVLRREGYSVERRVTSIHPARIRDVRDDAAALLIELASAGKPFTGKHWARVKLPETDESLMSGDEFIDLLDHRARHSIGRDHGRETTLEWRWGEQVHLQRFQIKSGRARGAMARYLAKYVTKSISARAGDEAQDADHRQGLIDAAELLPCATHGFYLCGCTLSASAIASFGFAGNPYSQSSNWGCSLTDLRGAKSTGEVRDCSWGVVGAGYPFQVEDALQALRAARARPGLDLRSVLRSLVPKVAGPAAP